VNEDKNNQLGRLISVHGISPAYIQRAVFIVILSFVFFLAMMFVYYIRQSIVYFLLSSAFLLLYLITMFSWVMQRRNVVYLFENGLEYRGRSTPFNDIKAVADDGVIDTGEAKPIVLPRTLHDGDRLIAFIRQKAALAARP
jgi:hypothetical protein